MVQGNIHSMQCGMDTPKSNLKEIAKLFFKLGCIGFGGPAAHIAMIEDEVVQKRKWLSREHFLDLIGATNLIPGPNSTEMTMHCGFVRAGNWGLIVAGCCFIFPAVVINSIVAWMYQLYGKLPVVEPFLYGIKPAIIAIIVSALVSLWKTAFKNVELMIIGTLTIATGLFGVNEIYALFGAGFLGIAIHFLKEKGKMVNGLFPVFLLQLNTTISFSSLFFVFLKIGAILYGSGYVLFAFLDAELVKTGLLSRQVLIDAIAVGQITPGPVFSAATFIGWQLGGWLGAIAATVGIFLPSFLFVTLTNPLIPKLRQSKIMSVFLDAINVGSVAVILSVVINMSRVAITDWRTVLIALLGYGVSFFFKKVNSAYIVIGGSVIGYLLYMLK